MKSNEKENIYEITCPKGCGVFEVSSNDVGLPPFTVACPFCDKEIDYQESMPNKPGKYLSSYMKNKKAGEAVTGYPAEYLEKYEVFHKQYKNKEEARTKAKELRSQGWEVKTKRWDFEDCGEAWEVDAKREKKQASKKTADNDQAWQDEAYEWAKEITEMYSNSSKEDTLCILNNACDTLNLDKYEMDKRYQWASGADFEDPEMVYFILTGDEKKFGKWFATKVLAWRVGEQVLYNPVGLDIFNPMVISGSPIEKGSVCTITKIVNDPAKYFVVIEDRMGNEQSVDKKSLTKIPREQETPFSMAGKKATGEPDQDYDHEIYDEIVLQLAKAGFKAYHQEFDKYQGVYIDVKGIDNFWTTDIYWAKQGTMMFMVLVPEKNPDVSFLIEVNEVNGKVNAEQLINYCGLSTPHEEVAGKKQANLAIDLMEMDNQIWDEMGYGCGTDVENDWEIYKQKVKKLSYPILNRAMGRGEGNTKKLDVNVYDELEDQNYHSLIQALMELGIIHQSAREKQTEWEIQGEPYYTADGFVMFHDEKGRKQKMKMDEIEIKNKKGKKIVTLKKTEAKNLNKSINKLSRGE